ncbi:MAG: hypothetical protein Q7R80_03110 [bacterium]|nr:hypothetical protein [bacterium]
MAKRMEDLFQRPLSELRTAFVRARFMETQVYGRPDIEEWIAREREAERPEYDYPADESPWIGFLSSDHMIFVARGREIEILTTLATPLAEEPTQLPLSAREREHYREVAHLLAMIDRRRVDTYYGYGSGVIPSILVTKPDGSDALALGKDAVAGIAIQPLRSEHVVDAVFGEWLHHRPRWRKARKFICDALTEEIRRERAFAEDDFDMAVAVSADGMEIVHADWVVVPHRFESGTKPLRTTIYHGADFFGMGQKALCPSDLHRVRERCEAPAGEVLGALGLPSLSGPFGTAILACVGPQMAQWLITTGDKKKVLITHPDLVPELAAMTPPWTDKD